MRTSPKLVEENKRQWEASDIEEVASDHDDTTLKSSKAPKGELKIERKKFLRQVRSGNCTLKELIDKFYALEEFYMIKKYLEGLCSEYAFAQAMSCKTVNHKGQRPLSL